MSPNSKGPTSLMLNFGRKRPQSTQPEVVRPASGLFVRPASSRNIHEGNDVVAERVAAKRRIAALTEENRSLRAQLAGIASPRAPPRAPPRSTAASLGSVAEPDNDLGLELHPSQRDLSFSSPRHRQKHCDRCGVEDESDRPADSNRPVDHVGSDTDSGRPPCTNCSGAIPGRGGVGSGIDRAVLAASLEALRTAAAQAAAECDEALRAEADREAHCSGLSTELKAASGQVRADPFG